MRIFLKKKIQIDSNEFWSKNESKNIDKELENYSDKISVEDPLIQGIDEDIKILKIGINKNIQFEDETIKKIIFLKRVPIINNLCLKD